MLIASTLLAAACSTALADRPAIAVPPSRIALGIAPPRIRAPYDVQFQWKFQPIDILETPTDPARPPSIPAWVVGEHQSPQAFERALAEVRRKQREAEYRKRLAGAPGALARFAALHGGEPHVAAKHGARDARSNVTPRTRTAAAAGAGTKGSDVPGEASAPDVPAGASLREERERR